MKQAVILSLLIASAMARAGGDSVGSGGVLWACRSGVGGRDFHSGILTDLFEAKEQYQWTLIDVATREPLQVYADRKAWLQSALPELYAALKPRFEYVEAHRAFVDADLLSTHDYNNALKPRAATCIAEWSPINIANFREEDQKVLISAELWRSPQLAALDKAALLFHEAVYYWMRTYYGSTNSDKARKLTGLLFSTKTPAEMKEEIARILGSYPDRPDGKFICVMKNSRRNQIYVAFDQSADDAALAVRTRCQDDPGAEWCARSSLECDEIGSTARHRCVAEHAGTKKIYAGRGRNLLEAEFNAHMACYVGSLALGASAQQCPDFTFMECD